MLLLLTSLLAPPHLAAPSMDWPQFLGPLRTGEAVLEAEAVDWAEAKPTVAWRTPIGRGYGGVAIRGDEVFLFDREVGTRDVLRVFDLATGEERWSAGYEAPGRLQFAGSRTVPTVSDEYVLTQGGFGHLSCFDRKERKLRWSIDLREDYGGLLPMFGFSAAPLLVGDLVVAAALGEEVGLVALEAATGDERWVSEPVGYSHSTPTLLELLGKQQVVFLSTMADASGMDEAAPTTVSAFDPESGDTFWRSEITLTRLPIPGPVQIDEERFFVTGGYRGGSTLLRISKGDEYALEELFHIERGAQIQTPILHEGNLYLLANENWNNERARRGEGGLMCLGLDGVERWRTGAEPFFGRGPVLLVGGYLVLQDGFNGVLRVARATPEGYQQVLEADFFEIDDRSDHEMWAPMALAGKRLLMRSQDELVCVQL